MSNGRLVLVNFFSRYFEMVRANTLSWAPSVFRSLYFSKYIIDLIVWLLPCWSWCNVQIVLYPGRTILSSWGVGLLITGWWSWIVQDFWILGVGLSHWLLWLEFMHCPAAVVMLIAALVTKQFLLFFIFLPLQPCVLYCLILMMITGFHSICETMIDIHPNGYK